MQNLILENHLHTLNLPTDEAGILCAVNIDGEIQTYSAGNIHGQEQTPFYIYSISKTFTATALLSLCESEGDFLDESAQSLLPHYSIPSEITVRQLLNHTSGLSDYFSQAAYQDAVHTHPSEPWQYEKLMQVGLKNSPLFTAGENWSYSNPGYGMLKEIIELKSGNTFYQYIEDNIFSPLGLTNTKPFTKLDTDHTLLVGSESAMEGDFRSLYHPGWIATGCFISTVTEITQFYQALFSGRILSQDSLSQMTQLVELRYPLPKPRIAAYGLGLMSVIHDPTGTHYGHGGGGLGYTTYARHYPDHHGRQISIAFVVNTTLAQTPFELADEIFLSLST